MMNSIVVSNLSKKYRIGIKDESSDTLINKILSILASPWKNLKKLRALNDFSKDKDSLFWAIHDLSFEIGRGEIVGIIGKNGAGKSTLLKILSQITEPTEGRIDIYGRVASLLEVGTGFHSELSGRDNIYMNGTILGMTRKEIDKKFDEIVDFSGIEKFVDTPVKFYSSGMKVRLGFSVAAYLEPEILIVDEVLAVGDYEFQKKCLGKMNEVSKWEGRTILFVSHQLSMISSLCNRTILMDKGKILFDGNTQMAISTYLKINKNNNSDDYNYLDSFVDGNKNIIVSKILLNPDGSQIFSFNSFLLNIFIEKNVNHISNDARVDVRIDDVLGNGLIWLSSKVNPSLDLNKLEIQFYLDKLPLVSGEYFITIFIHDGINVACHYNNVKSFFVIDFPYFLNEVKIPLGQTSIIASYDVF
jgi:lipopolysaccharide transport system ATP-binding protein